MRFAKLTRVTVANFAAKASKRIFSEDISSHTDMLKFAHENTVNTREALDNVVDPDELLVIGTFSAEVEVEEEKVEEVKRGGRVVKNVTMVKVKKVALTMAYACKAIILYILALASAGHVFALQTDGTYRWVLFVVPHSSDSSTLLSLNPSLQRQVDECWLDHSCPCDDAR